jgi:EmrB/QacA subfamily drug resistance transporter
VILDQYASDHIVISTAKVNKTQVLVAACLSYFIAGFMTTGLNVALPDISRDFQANAILLSWVVTVYFLPTAVLILPFSKLSDVLGIKKVFIIGMIIFAAAGTAAIFSNSISMLITCRVVQGISGACIWGNCQSMVTAAYPAKERGRALGITVAAYFISSSAAPYLGGLLTDHFGWRTIFIAAIPISLAVFLLILWNIRGDWIESRESKIDYSGSVIYGVSLIALIYGFSELPGVPGLTATPVGIIGIALFLWWEGRTQNPILDVKIFRSNRIFIFSNLTALVCYCATFSLLFLMSLYLQYIKGFSAEHAGLILIAQPVMQFAFSPITGRLSDRMDPRIVVSIGLTMTCLGLFSFVFLASDTSLIQVIIALMVIGVGLAFFQSPNINATMSSVEPKYYNIASATTVTMRTVGQTLSMGITMTVMAVIIGGAVITAANYPQFLSSARIILGINTALCLIGLFLSLARGRAQ